MITNAAVGHPNVKALVYIDAYVNPAAFRRVFAADIPARTAAVLATSQRPSTLATGEEPSGPPAWATIPS